MGLPLDLTGHKFGRLTALRRETTRTPYKNGIHYRAYWYCVCECGNEVRVLTGSLRDESTKSCGCLLREKALITCKSRAIHNLTDTPIHKSWQKMKERCLNENHMLYHRYGGRGITICKEWRDFTLFLRDMEDTWFPGATLDRIDSNGHYEKNNCQWLSRADNSAKKCFYYEYKGKQMSLREIAEDVGIPYKTLKARS